ncbi:MAG: polysaccharide biosynthesis protein [Undibacterium sp.]|nr:polysaccharide biosynthesis protein [Opitutaceae bacterium]
MSISSINSAIGRATLVEQVTRALGLLALYVVILAACQYAAYEIRFDFLVPPDFQHERLLSLVVNLPVKIGFLVLFRQFGSLLTYFSVPDMVKIAGAMAAANVVSFILRTGLTPGLSSPRGVILMDFVLSVGALCLLRLMLRIYRERYLSGIKRDGKPVRRIAVLGAGDAGAQFVREIQAKPALGLQAVFFLDDDAKKHRHDIYGVSVMGAPEDLGRLKAENRIDACVLAMPSASGKRIQEICRLVAAEGLKAEILPSMAELASGRVQVTKIRPVQVEDLLGRASVDLRSDAVAALIQDKVVLVTGAGGSIGSELCRQLATYNPRRLLLVEQAEGSLFLIEMELNESGLQHRIVPLVADILDLPRMEAIFARYAPQVIFHAAAHKHVFMMERQPGEAVKNNTMGTRQLAELASARGIETFVFISTDKAINPTSVMGVSKRLAEIHLQALQHRPGNGTHFIAVRFGNVLGSSGSVIPIFKKQIAGGGPVTVTHPDVTRYFMTIPEAVGLVLQTAVMGRGGEIFVLDMGKPVRIVDLARQLIELSGLRPDLDIEIKVIGLRPGEKLFEELQHHSELLKPTAHARVMLLAQADAASTSDTSSRCVAEIEGRVGELEAQQLKLAIKRLVPEYTPHLD